MEALDIKGRHGAHAPGSASTTAHARTSLGPSAHVGKNALRLRCYFLIGPSGALE